MRRIALSAGAGWLAAFLTASASAAEREKSAAVQVRFASEAPARVQVTGLSRTSLRQLQRARWAMADWQRLLAVHAEQGDLAADIGLPAMAGEYRIESDTVLFLPRFPFDPGVSYRATFHPALAPGGRGAAADTLTATFRMPPRPAGAATVVTQVYPSADRLPENLLKFYLHFSAPMSRGDSYQHIRLLNEQGKSIELPFLELDEELWDAKMERLTLFIDPGRIKRGVRPLEEVGPSLEEGKRYTLVIDRDWHDAHGNLLQRSYEKKFSVGPPDRSPPDPKEWVIEPPVLARRNQLVITFPGPMDHALALRLIRVMRGDRGSHPVEGAAALEDQERRWIFTPAQPWATGAYQIVVPSIIEDLAGNNIGKPFEVDLFETVQSRLTNSVARVPFEVR